ncbi:hypothetical protein [Flavobacterium sp. 3HN19-14]|uniref:hypothetical protein n=1 Tax=Flavobacterium sp. 3HN19-14 TaxID=3448133 RepID=UPI003EE2D3D9
MVTTDDNDSYFPGQLKTYHVTVTNMGSDTATQVHVTGEIPAGVNSVTWLGNSTGGNGRYQ